MKVLKSNRNHLIELQILRSYRNSSKNSKVRCSQRWTSIIPSKNLLRKILRNTWTKFWDWWTSLIKLMILQILNSSIKSWRIRSNNYLRREKRYSSKITRSMRWISRSRHSNRNYRCKFRQGHLTLSNYNKLKKDWGFNAMSVCNFKVRLTK